LVTHPHNRKDNPMNDPTAKTTAEWPGIEDAAGLLNFRIAEWHDFGYTTPPAPHCKTIPPLGERSAAAIKGAHGAIEAIDELVRELHALRAQLVTEIQADQDARAVRQCNACPAPASCSEFGHCTLEQAPAAATAREALRAQLAGLVQNREAWEETARACVCPPGLCTRSEFRDHAGESEGCMVCADLDPEQPCYAAVVRGLREREEAGR
jgi:hypothetical protein